MPNFEFGRPADKDQVADPSLISLFQPLERPFLISQSAIDIGQPRG